MVKNIIKQFANLAILLALIASCYYIVYGVYLVVNNKTDNISHIPDIGGLVVISGILIIVLTTFLVYFKKNLDKLHFSNIFYYGIVSFAIMAQIFGEIYDFYYYVSWWDGVLHFASGILICYFIYKVIKYYFSISNIYLQSYLILSGSVLISVLWEFAEFFLDNVLGFNTQKGIIVDPTNIDYSLFTNNINLKNGHFIAPSLVDTMQDMILAFLGSIIFILIIIYIDKKKQYKIKENK